MVTIFRCWKQAAYSFPCQTILLQYTARLQENFACSYRPTVALQLQDTSTNISGGHYMIPITRNIEFIYDGCTFCMVHYCRYNIPILISATQ